MCDDYCPKFQILNVINCMLSVTLLVLHGVYAIWGLILPYASDRDKLRDYIDNLELYLNVVTYSDSVLIPLKVLFGILVKKCCCNHVKRNKTSDSDDGYDTCKYRNNKKNTFQVGQISKSNKNNCHENVQTFQVV